MVKPISTQNKSDFDWNNIISFGIGPSHIPLPSKEERETPKTVIDMYVGLPPKNYGLAYMISGVSISSKNVSLTSKVKDYTKINEKDEISLVIQIDSELWQFIELEIILDSNGLKIIETLVASEKPTLISIANEYEKHNRQLYHFMYDLIGLIRAISKLTKDEQKELLSETKTAIKLLHNRVHAEIFAEYKKIGIPVKLNQQRKQSSRKPDLAVHDVFADVKSILITDSKDKEKLLNSFRKKIKKDIILKENKKQQIGETGSFFVAIWSGIISSIFYIMYGMMKNSNIFQNIIFSETVPTLEKNKAILVIPSPHAFKNYYLIMERKRLGRIADFFAKKGYKKIKKYDSMAYLALSNIRKGCPFGITGKNASMIFKIT